MTKSTYSSNNNPCVNIKSNVQHLIYPESPPSCRKTGNTQATPVMPSNIKHIKVCTGAELKKTCFKSRPCKPVLIPKSASQRIASLFGFGMKSAIAGGMIYVTYNMGLWGGSENTEHIWYELCQIIGLEKEQKTIKLSPKCKAERELAKMGDLSFPSSCAKFFDTEKNLYNIQSTWNKMVTNIFWVLVTGPSEFINSFNEKSDKTPKK